MERLWNRNYNGVMLANFLMYFAFYLLTPLLPLYLADTFHATKDTIGLVLSGYVVAGVVIRPLSGFVLDTFHRRRVYLLCLASFAIVFAGYLGATTLLMFAIVRTLHGAPFGAVTVAGSTVAIDVLPPSRRNEGMGYYGLSNNLAMAIAPTCGIWLYHATGHFAHLFWLSLAIALLGLAVGWQVDIAKASPATIASHEAHAESRRTTNGKKPSPHDGNRSRAAYWLSRFFLTRAWLLAVNIALFGFCWGTLSNYLAIYSREVLHITGGTGTYFAILSTGLMLSRLQGAKALRQGLLVESATQGMLVSLTGFIIFVAIPHPITYYLSAILIGLGNGHIYPAFLNMFIHCAHSNERGTASSTILTGWDLGFGAGVLLGGIVAEHFNYSAAFWMVASINATAVALFLTTTKTFYRRKKLG